MVKIVQIIHIRHYINTFCELFVSSFALIQFMVINCNLRGDQVTRIESFFMSKIVCKLVLGFKIHQLIPIKLVRTNTTPKTFPVTNLSKRQDCLKITLVNWFWSQYITWYTSNWSMFLNHILQFSNLRR